MEQEVPRGETTQAEFKSWMVWSVPPNHCFSIYLPTTYLPSPIHPSLRLHNAIFHLTTQPPRCLPEYPLPRPVTGALPIPSLSPLPSQAYLTPLLSVVPGSFFWESQVTVLTCLSTCCTSASPLASVLSPSEAVLLAHQ